MNYELEKIKDLTKEIFERSANVSSYTVRKIGTKYIVKILNSKKEITFGMRGSYNNLVAVCKMIIKEQKIKPAK